MMIYAAENFFSFFFLSFQLRWHMRSFEWAHGWIGIVSLGNRKKQSLKQQNSRQQKRGKRDCKVNFSRQWNLISFSFVSRNYFSMKTRGISEKRWREREDLRGEAKCHEGMRIIVMNGNSSFLRKLFTFSYANSQKTSKNFQHWFHFNSFHSLFWFNSFAFYFVALGNFSFLLRRRRSVFRFDKFNCKMKKTKSDSSQHCGVCACSCSFMCINASRN